MADKPSRQLVHATPVEAGRAVTPEVARWA